MQEAKQRHKIHHKWLQRLRRIVEKEAKAGSLKGVIRAWRDALAEHYGAYDADALVKFRQDMVKWMDTGASWSDRFLLFRLIMESECLKELRHLQRQRNNVRSAVRSAEDLKKLHFDDLVMWIRQLRDEEYLSLDDIDPSPLEWLSNQGG